MARDKYDGVLEAVHYAPDGKVDWVRAFERRGSTFSDRLILDRDALISRIKQGKRYFAGQRVPYLASTFNISRELYLVTGNNKEVLVVGGHQTNVDDLKGVPVI
jgi:hypothetical protein